MPTFAIKWYREICSQESHGAKFARLFPDTRKIWLHLSITSSSAGSVPVIFSSLASPKDP